MNRPSAIGRLIPLSCSSDDRILRTNRLSGFSADKSARPPFGGRALLSVMVQNGWEKEVINIVKRGAAALTLVCPPQPGGSEGASSCIEDAGSICFPFCVFLEAALV